jgi:hypothetical protein
MEALLDFLFGNPIILIILIGALSSLMGKRKKRNGEGQQPKRGLPDVLRRTLSEYFPEEQSVPKKAVPTTVKSPVIEAEKDSVKIDTFFVPTETNKQVEHNIMELKGLPIEESPIYRADFSLDQKKLIDGIILAEILGPPRAKRKYRR